jgi:hypothetical protein
MCGSRRPAISVSVIRSRTAPLNHLPWRWPRWETRPGWTRNPAWFLPGHGKRTAMWRPPAAAELTVGTSAALWRPGRGDKAAMSPSGGRREVLRGPLGALESRALLAMETGRGCRLCGCLVGRGTLALPADPVRSSRYGVNRQEQGTRVFLALAVVLVSLWTGGLAAPSAGNLADFLATSRSQPGIQPAALRDGAQPLRPAAKRPDPRGRLLPLLAILAAAVTGGCWRWAGQRNGLARAGSQVCATPLQARAPPHLQPA